jgi:solute carrier family 10 (sodium/bile acid cotransporter), member 7
LLKRLSTLPIDTFLLAMAATVALAALLPARGAAADVVSVAAKAVIALLFWLYGARCRRSRHGRASSDGNCT